MAGGFVVGAGVLAQSVHNLQATAPSTAGSAPLARVAEAISISTGMSLPPDVVAQAPVVLLPDWQGTERINVLLLGIDQRDDEAKLNLPTRTDSMIVVSIDPVAKNAAMISFPRDLYLTIPGFGEQRINEAFPLGELYRVDGGGPGLAGRTLDLNFGLQVPYYAIVNFHGFETIIDTLGGIVVDVPRPVKDDEYPTVDYGIERLYVSLGPQLMDGSFALKYARTRHKDNDIYRNSRQQQVLLAIRDRALRPDTFARAPTLVDQGLRTVKTNFTATELLALAKLASQIDNSAISSLVVQYPLVVDYRGVGGAALLLPRKNDIRAAIRKTLDAGSPLVSPATPAPPS